MNLPAPSGNRVDVSGSTAIYDGAGRLFVKAYLRDHFYQDCVWLAKPDGTVDHVVWGMLAPEGGGRNSLVVDPNGVAWHVTFVDERRLRLDRVPEFVPLPKVSGGTVAPIPHTHADLADRLTSIERSVWAQAARIAELEARPTALTSEEIAVIAWSKAVNAVYQGFAQRLDHTRPDYDRSLRDWVYEKVKAWLRGKVEL